MLKPLLTFLVLGLGLMTVSPTALALALALAQAQAQAQAQPQTQTPTKPPGRCAEENAGPSLVSLFEVIGAEGGYYTNRVAHVNALFDAQQVVAQTWSMGRGVTVALQ